jgi:hypothetical protein
MGRRKRRGGGIAPVALALAYVLAAPRVAAAYSVLAHEAIIDAAWDASIVPAPSAKAYSVTSVDSRRSASTKSPLRT